MNENARLYFRRNGSFGSSCDGCLDTGHHIVEDSGNFTVWSVHNEDRRICRNATRAEAERAITEDWRACLSSEQGNDPR